jgi:hypothetical protein
MEFQDLVMFAILPAAHTFADREFVRGANQWFNEASYIAMCQATGFDMSSPHRKFLLSHDGDSRHSYYHHSVVNGRRVQVDRRLLPQGSKLAIPLHPERDYVPLCVRVPDCIQSPIEMFFAPIKCEFKRLLAATRREGRDTSPKAVIEAALQAFREKGTAVNVKSCWMHAEKSLLVWTRPRDQWVEIDGVRYMGSGGNWVPKALAG